MATKQQPAVDKHNTRQYAGSDTDRKEDESITTKNAA